MKQLTTAEFAKANLAALDEPVEVRRYTKVVGTYYPTGFAPGTSVETLSLVLDAGLAEINAQKRVDDLEDEIKRLKRALAAKDPMPANKFLESAVSSQTARTPRSPFSGLSKQDAEFFERKMGKRKG